MPKTKVQAIFFTLITAWMMVYCMTLYNLVLAAGEFTNQSFLLALKSMWLEYVVIFLCAALISTPLAKRLAFRVVVPQDCPIAIILTVQVFMVVLQVALASILGVWKGYGFTAQLLPNYLTVYARNLLMAMPLQLLFVGPLARGLLRLVFSEKAQNG